NAEVAGEPWTITMADAPRRAPAKSSDSLRIILCPSGKPFYPPRSGINGFSILSKLNVKQRSPVAYFYWSHTCQQCFSHSANRFSCQDELTLSHIDSAQSCHYDMISTAGVQDQELSIGSESTRI